MVKKLTELPSQAFRGTLDYIRPIGVRWSRDASYSFLAWVNNELLYAKATEINVEVSILFVYEKLICFIRFFFFLF